MLWVTALFRKQTGFFVNCGLRSNCNPDFGERFFHLTTSKRVFLSEHFRETKVSMTGVYLIRFVIILDDLYEFTVSQKQRIWKVIGKSIIDRLFVVDIEVEQALCQKNCPFFFLTTIDPNCYSITIWKRLLRINCVGKLCFSIITISRLKKLGSSKGQWRLCYTVI